MEANTHLRPHSLRRPPPTAQGAGVTSTIKSGIAKTSSYTDSPDILMYGMMCAVFAAGIWLLLACYFEVSGALPVTDCSDCSSRPLGCQAQTLTGSVSRRRPPLKLPVSTTHSIVGAIVGMSVTARGFDSVVWYKHKDPFPYIDGVVGIVSGETTVFFALFQQPQRQFCRW